MSGHIEQIRHRYDQFSRGDIQGAAQDWTDDFVLARRELRRAAHGRHALRQARGA